MALGASSSCLNHLAVEAVGRCKQCGKPFCSACRVTGPTGNFCGAECKQKHEVFVQRAQQLERGSARSGYLVKLRRLLVKAVIWIVVILAVAIIITYYGVYDIPVLSGLIRHYVLR